jgi:hypothetical protein
MSVDARLENGPPEARRTHDRLRRIPDGLRAGLRSAVARADERRRVAELVQVLSVVSRTESGLRPPAA